MNFEIESKGEDGSIVFKGTASQAEASFLLNVGISYLLAQGVMPLLTGGMDKDSTVSETPQGGVLQ
jgi:hypothetical protein